VTLAIFPINDRIVEIGKEPQQRMKHEFSKDEIEELKGLIRKRIRQDVLSSIMPLTASVIKIFDLLS
jgi:hypothetical protein